LKKANDEKYEDPATDGQSEAPQVEAMNIAPTHLDADKTAHHRPDNAEDYSPNNAHGLCSRHDETSQNPDQQPQNNPGEDSHQILLLENFAKAKYGFG
jgi:hypothetical protein